MYGSEKLSRSVRESYSPILYWETVFDLKFENLFFIRTSFLVGAKNAFEFKTAFWEMTLVDTRSFVEFYFAGFKSFKPAPFVRLNPFIGYSFLDYKPSSEQILLGINLNSLDKKYHSFLIGVECVYTPYSWFLAKLSAGYSPLSTLVNEKLPNVSGMPNSMQMNYVGDVSINAYLFSLKFVVSVRQLFELPNSEERKRDYILITEYGIQFKLKL